MIPTTSTDRISNSALPVWVFNEQNFFASQFACDTVAYGSNHDSDRRTIRVSCCCDTAAQQHLVFRVWVAYASRVLAMASSPMRTFSSGTSSRMIFYQKKRLFRRDAESPSRTGISTRDACATRNFAATPTFISIYPA